MLIVFFLSNNVFNNVFREIEIHDYAQSKNLIKNINDLQSDKLSLVLESMKNDDIFLHSTLLANELGYINRPKDILAAYINKNDLSFYIYMDNDTTYITNINSPLSPNFINQLCSSNNMTLTSSPLAIISKCDELTYHRRNIGLIIVGYYLADYSKVLSNSLSKEMDIILSDENNKLNKYNLSFNSKKTSSISIMNLHDKNYYIYHLDNFFPSVDGFLTVKQGPRASVYSKYTLFGKTLIYYLILFIVIILTLYFVFWSLISKRLRKIHEFIADQLSKRKIALKLKTEKIDEIGEIDITINDLFDQLTTYQKEKEESAHLAAIGKTTAMVAHDVRKPFSTVKSILDVFDEFQKEPLALEQAKLNINKSIKHVETMLSDIMDFSRDVKLEVQPHSIINILDFSIRQAAQNHPNANIEFIYNINNTFEPLVDEERMSRVLVNILGNAMEAIHDLGKKQIGTIDISIHNSNLNNGKFISLTIGNNGPALKEEDIPKLFESFFTKGKKKGTGLGLASAQRIVTLHNGTIISRNKKDKEGVEFEINIPSSEHLETGHSSILPSNIKDTMFVKLIKDYSEINSLVRNLSKEANKYKVLLLEDEVLYRASVRNTIKRNEDLDRILTLYEVQTVEEATKLIDKEEITHAIVDIDLGEIKNGFDFLEEVKTWHPNLNCMVHSNRCIDEDKEKAKRLGAKAFVPKPLSIEHLVMFLSDINISEMDENEKKIILYADDEAVMRISMETIIKSMEQNTEFYAFEDGESLFDKLQELGKCHVVLTDQNMGKGITGLELVQQIKEANYSCKVYVVANEPKSTFEETALKAGADGYFNAPIEKYELENILSETQSIKQS